MAGPDSERDDRVLGFTRGTSLFIVPFLLVAFVILYFFPGETTRLWAWTIPATMTSMTLASAYLGGAYFFLRVQREQRWTPMKFEFPAVATFSGLLGVATILHWDKFNHEHVSFRLWAGLYFIAPPLVVLAWVRNMRYAPPAGAGRTHAVAHRPGRGGSGRRRSSPPGRDHVPLARCRHRRLAVAADPAHRSRARRGAVPRGGGARCGFDPRWAAVRLMTEVAAVMVTLLLLAAVRARGELDASRALAWPLLVGMVALLLCTVALWVRYEWLPRQERRRAATAA